jgi:hypothetical protein
VDRSLRDGGLDTDTLWLRGLGGDCCKNLKELRVTGAGGDVANPLATSILGFGERMTTLKLTGLTRVMYSHLQAIKGACPNLAVFCLETAGTVDRGNVDLQHLREPFVGLFALRELRLWGNFGSDVVSYLLRRADDLRSLSLVSNWPDDDVPAERDLLGVAFFSELLSANKMSKLEEVYLAAELTFGVHAGLEGRSSNNLAKACADLILATFPKLKYLGDFRQWKMTGEEIRSVVSAVQSANRDVTFEEDLGAKYVVGRDNLVSRRRHPSQPFSALVE